MKVRDVIVPRQAISTHFPHIEAYGESIVNLVNGMSTDVYTSEEGHLFTPTNNKALIEYLHTWNTPDLALEFSKNKVKLRTLTQADTSLLSQSFYPHASRFDHYLVEPEVLRIWISQAITANSHVFLVSHDDAPIGTMGFHVVNDQAVLSIDLFDQSNSKDVLGDALSLMLQYIEKTYRLTRLVCSVMVFVLGVQELLTCFEFKASERLVLRRLNTMMVREIEYEKTIQTLA